MGWAVGDLGCVSARPCLPSTWLPVHKVGCRSSGLQGPLTVAALDPEGQGPTVPPGVGLGIRRWPPAPPRALGGQTTLPNPSPWGFSRPSQAVWLLLLEKMFSVPIIPGPEGLQGARAG